jgi:hypothetical protein
MEKNLLTNQVLIGCTLEESAYHEAGHVVVASALGLDLRPRGIVIYEVQNVTDGLACYWEDTAETEEVLQALRAGQMAQMRRFPKSDTWGSMPDIQQFATIYHAQFGPNGLGDMNMKINGLVNGLLCKHWSAIEAVAKASVDSDWIAVDSTEHPMAIRKKHLSGEALVPILAAHGISAHVRS